MVKDKELRLQEAVIIYKQLKDLGVLTLNNENFRKLSNEWVTKGTSGNYNFKVDSIIIHVLYSNTRKSGISIEYTDTEDIRYR